MGEAVSVLCPPPPTAGEPLRAAHLVPHRDELRVAGLDPPAHELAAAVHGDFQRCEQLGPPVSVEPVRVGDQPEPCDAVRGMPAQPGGVGVVVDGHAHPGELSEVVDWAARGTEVEVEQADGDAAIEHDVLEADIVVAHDRAPGGVGHLGAPGVSGGVEVLRCVVELREQRRGRCQSGVVLGPRRIRRHRDVALDEHESFPAVVVEADGQRCAFEPGFAQRRQEGVDRFGLGARGAQHMGAGPDDLSRVRDAADELLLLHPVSFAQFRTHRGTGAARAAWTTRCRSDSRAIRAWTSSGTSMLQTDPEWPS